MKLWRRCEKCEYQNYIDFQDEKLLEFRCKRCGAKTITAKYLSTLATHNNRCRSTLLT
jgi:predicted nucleic-acid-binding Zn-ribbon protein